MTTSSSTLTGLAQGWCTLSVLHQRIESHLERVLQAEHGISVREYSLLEVLSRQHDGGGGHLHMKEVSAAVVLSESATTRLVTRLEDRGLLARFLCPTDRRGIYTNVTPEGMRLLEAARPTNQAALSQALEAARMDPQLKKLVEALDSLCNSSCSRVQDEES